MVCVDGSVEVFDTLYQYFPIYFTPDWFKRVTKENELLLIHIFNKCQEEIKGSWISKRYNILFHMALGCVKEQVYCREFYQFIYAKYQECLFNEDDFGKIQDFIARLAFKHQDTELYDLFKSENCTLDSIAISEVKDGFKDLDRVSELYQWSLKISKECVLNAVAQDRDDIFPFLFKYINTKLLGGVKSNLLQVILDRKAVKVLGYLVEKKIILKGSVTKWDQWNLDNNLAFIKTYVESYPLKNIDEYMFALKRCASQGYLKTFQYLFNQFNQSTLRTLENQSLNTDQLYGEAVAHCQNEIIRFLAIDEKIPCLDTTIFYSAISVESLEIFNEAGHSNITTLANEDLLISKNIPCFHVFKYIIDGAKIGTDHSMYLQSLLYQIVQKNKVRHFKYLLDTYGNESIDINIHRLIIQNGNLEILKYFDQYILNNRSFIVETYERSLEIAIKNNQLDILMYYLNNNTYNNNNNNNNSKKIIINNTILDLVNQKKMAMLEYLLKTEFKESLMFLKKEDLEIDDEEYYQNFLKQLIENLNI
ncbi:hypothetical protein CYY_008559 [Polysphondylium violaceum]|nr:hypothetical protein CYY_008559 [Polysphondylium violaceum]